MNVAGPSSRASIGRLTQEERVESTYEEDLLGLLEQLDPDEIDDFQALCVRKMQNGHIPSDHDLAMLNLLQQIRELADINEDRVLAQRIADEGDIRTETDESTDGLDVRTETEESVGSEDIEETEESSDVEVEDIGEEGNHQQRGVRTVRNGVARFFPRRRFSFIGRFFGSKFNLALARHARVAFPKIPAVHRQTGHVCAVCQDPIQGAEIRVPCGHYFDIGCITHLFQFATHDETLFPPRCCGKTIPFSRVRSRLSPALIMTFKQKRAEFSTLKRVYCSSLTCSHFLGPVREGVFGGRVYTCPARGCRRRTCGKCREQHSGDRTHVCRPDAGATQVLELSRASGWARCPGCSHMIELHIGCFHTTCRCGTEFCYLCRALWKTCECPQWDEQRLMVDGGENDHE